MFDVRNRSHHTHPKSQPYTFLCNSMSMMASIAHIEHSAYRVLKRILPGPYTIILQSHHELPRIVKDKRLTVGVRIPNSKLIHAILTEHRQPIFTTSFPAIEKLGTEENLVYGYQVEEALGNCIDLILDLGDGLCEEQTSIIDLQGGNLEIIREGVGDTEQFLKEKL